MRPGPVLGVVHLVEEVQESSSFSSSLPLPILLLYIIRAYLTCTT